MNDKIKQAIAAIQFWLLGAAFGFLYLDNMIPFILIGIAISLNLVYMFTEEE